ncbi:MAG TPA: hypothetical protein VFZ24_08265 [Longimicrobiales bacterium]
MNDDEIRDIAAGLARRGGLTRLLSLLGFEGAPRRRAIPRTLHASVRALRVLRRETITLHILELRDGSAAAATRELCDLARRDEPVTHHVLIVVEPRRRRIVIGCQPLGAGLRHLVLEPAGVRNGDVDVLRDLAAEPDESGTAAALRIHRALDRRRLTGRFFRDVRAVRDAVARAWTGVSEDASADRDALALLLLSRLMFLSFLQRRGLLGGDPRFLPRLLARWRRTTGRRGTFYRTALRTLFFGVLNRRPEHRTARARAFGGLPYLNGGLFEKHRVELRRGTLDLDDGVIASVFDGLLEKYRFTTADDACHGDVGIGTGIDPEMLGRIFEGLMPGERRSRTGTFYTPAAAVDDLVTDALSAHLEQAGVTRATARALMTGAPCDASDRELLVAARAADGLRVLDPACGSGAFLLGALSQIERLRGAGRVGANRAGLRRDLVARTLHGVDLLEDAALICSLRLWLSLVPQGDRPTDVPPLPNLDRRIRQGDALIDPLDVGAALAGRVAPPAMRATAVRLAPCARRYLSSGPDERLALRRELATLESRLARGWLDMLECRLREELREIDARAGDTDLFGAPTALAQAARARRPVVTSRLSELHRFRGELRGSRALPFFSFRVHFAEVDGFDVVLCNPPWVRAHNWPPTVRHLLRDRYRVCAAAGWPHAAASTGTPHAAGAQVDLAFLFLERSLRLLREGGTLGMVLPAKLIRSLAPGGARALLQSDARITSIEDHSLDQRAVFDADAFTAAIVARRCASADPAARVRVRMTRRCVPDLSFDVRASELPLRPGDARAPWLLAPPDGAAALRAMQRAGTPIGSAGLCVRRGAMTGANEVMIVRHLEPKLGDLARIRTEGWYARAAGRSRRSFTGHVEASALRPVLRGTDVHAWRTTIERYVLYSPQNDDRRARPPRRLERFLARHRVADGGRLHRLSADTFGHKVVWPDLGADLRAAAVPAAVRSAGLDLPVIPLNTVYFIPTTCERESLLLAAYLNSLPLRTFARAIAERAKDAHFRFFAWAIAMLPLPPHWRESSVAERLIALALAAHAAGSLERARQGELDERVARAFGLDAGQLESLAAFDAWLAGRSSDA